MKFRPSTPTHFNPSHFNPSDTTSGEEEAGGYDEYMEYVPIAGALFREFTGAGKSEAESAAEYEARLAILKRDKENAPDTGKILGVVVPGTKQYIQNQILKVKAQLAAARKQAEAEQTSSDLYIAGQAGMVFLLFGLTLAGVGLAVYQLQKSRLTQAQIRQLQSQTRE